METIILLAVGLLALVIIYIKAKKLMDTVRGKPVKSSCDCGNCSSSCCIREFPNTAGKSNQS